MAYEASGVQRLNPKVNARNIVFGPIAAFFALCCCAPAQISQVNGTINGVITDPTGSPISKASVVATGADTGFERQTQSNERGEYHVPLLPLGTYQITVEAPGFAHYTQTGISVRIDAASQANVALQLSSSTRVSR